MGCLMKAWEDSRIIEGMKAQFAQRAERMRAGEQRLGWKLGVYAPAMREKFQLDGPLVGYMERRALVPSGGFVSLKGWAKPVAEPEIAVHMGQDLGAGADRATAAAAIGAIGPAIELVDLDPPPSDLTAILKGNIWHRHVILGTPDASRAGGNIEGLTCRAIRRGAEAARTTDPQANIGELIAIVSHCANVVAAFGEKLSAGDVIITGSTTPALAIESDEEGIGFELDPIGGVSVRFTR